MGYNRVIDLTKCEDLLEAKAEKSGCDGLVFSRMVRTKLPTEDGQGEYDQVDLILQDLGGNKFTVAVSKADLLSALEN